MKSINKISSINKIKNFISNLDFELYLNICLLNYIELQYIKYYWRYYLKHHFFKKTKVISLKYLNYNFVEIFNYEFY